LFQVLSFESLRELCDMLLLVNSVGDISRQK
jgi:hypothetical protein